MPFTRQAPFTKKTTDLPDSPTSAGYSASDIKAYIETPANENKTFVNTHIAELESNTGASNIGAKDIAGATSTVQEETDKANNGLKTHKEATTLDHPDKSVTESKLADKSVSRRTIQGGAVGLDELDPIITSQPKTEFEVQAKFAEIDTELAEKATLKKLGDLSYLLQQDGIVTTITGDSLSYNRYGFESVSRANAYECLPGILSWSFLLRDAIHRNDLYFIHGDEVKFRNIRTTTTFGLSTLPAFTLPFNNRFIEFNVFDNTEEINIPYLHHNNTNKAVLYLSSNPTDSACSFDVYVDGIFIKNVNNNGAGKNYQGYQPLFIDLPLNGGAIREIQLKNFVQVAATPDAGGKRTIYLNGIGSKYSPVYLTGKGGETASYFITNLASRITNDNPDVVFFIIGANDRATKTVEQFETDLRSVISGIRSNKKNTQIVLISPPSAEDENNPTLDNGSYIPDSKTKLYIDKMVKVAVEYECFYLDLLQLFKNMSKSMWRFDNVHMTRKGNCILARTILDYVLPNGLYDKKMVDSDQSWNNGTPYKQIEQVRGWAKISYNGTSYSVTSQQPNNGIRSVTKPASYFLRINFSYRVSDADFSFIIGAIASQFGSISQVLYARPHSVGLNYIQFAIAKADGTLATDADLTGSANFLISY